MNRSLLIIILFCSSIFQAQDFTNEVQSNDLEKVNQNILVVPFKSQFLLSEIDRGLVNSSGKEVFEVRDGITQSLINQTAELFTDSINCRALDNNLESSNLSFIHHQLSYGYKEVPASEDEDKKKFSLKRTIKEKTNKNNINTPPGYNTSVSNGQISKDPIFNERYMSAKIKTPEMMEFIKSEYQAELIVVLTELDLMKAKGIKAVEEYEYIATLHYVIFNDLGELMEGNKIEKYFNKSEFNLSELQTNVLSPLSQSIHDRTILYLTKNSPVYNAVEDNDY